MIEKACKGMKEWSYKKTKRVSVVANRPAKNMKFVVKMRLLQYREARQGKHWVPTKDETRPEVMYGVGCPLCEYHYRKDADIIRLSYFVCL